jgi:signal transduction histidine kinase/CheY-like chemotaxis protein
MHSVARTGKHYFSTDEVFVRKDGTVFPILAIASPIYEEGRVVASLTAFRDISDVKKLEEEVQKAQRLDSVGVLAGGIAHDFNNLLQAILGNISLARMFAPAGARHTERLADAERAVNQARELSYRLLTFSKGGAPVREIVAIGPPLRESVALALSGSNITPEYAIAADLDSIEADANQLQQVFHNLALNAKEAMPHGGTLQVQARNVAVSRGDGFSLREGPYVLISFRDHGAGIAKNDLSRVFDPYFTTKEVTEGRGRGLGLAVSHSIIKKHDGTISVESDPGKGAAFHIFLPALPDKNPREDRAAEAPVAGTGRVLLMDDEQQVQSVVGEMLRQAGYEVSTAKNGEEAVMLYQQAMAATKPFDVVILDLTVPGGMGGEPTLERLRLLDPQVKAIVSSGYVDAPIMKDSARYGFAAAIAKPYDVNGLLAMMARVLPKKS